MSPRRRAGPALMDIGPMSGNLADAFPPTLLGDAEAAMEPVAAAVPDSLLDDEPSADDIAIASAFVEAHIGGDPIPHAFNAPCPHCAGSGRVYDPSQPEAESIVFPEERAPHALDSAPENSKIVVVLLEGKSHAVMAGPDGAKELPVGDPAHRLPEGARILKLRDGQGYEATQMSATVDYPPMRTTTAGEAIAGFIAHFHPHGLS